jgi:hypothetical protein
MTIEKNNKNFNEILEDVKRRYNLSDSIPKGGLTQQTINKINKSVFDECYDYLVSCDAAETASKIHAYEIWTI